MLSILRSKKYLTGLFDNYTDIHNHIIPGIDDGSKNVEESETLINSLKELGITDFICTPHTMGDFYPNTPKTITLAADVLRNELARKQDGTRIRAASEYMLDEQFSNHLKADQLLPLHKRYLLVELSYLQPPINLEELLFELTHAGYVPVLAHPERYSYYHKKPAYYAELQRLGCLLQLNALSLSDHYGGTIKSMAFKLLENDQYSFLGTDTHNLKHVEQLKAVTYKKKHAALIEKVLDETKNTFGLDDG